MHLEDDLECVPACWYSLRTRCRCCTRVLRALRAADPEFESFNERPEVPDSAPRGSLQKRSKTLLSMIDNRPRVSIIDCRLLSFKIRLPQCHM